MKIKSTGIDAQAIIVTSDLALSLLTSAETSSILRLIAEAAVAITPDLPDEKGDPNRRVSLPAYAEEIGQPLQTLRHKLRDANIRRQADPSLGPQILPVGKEGKIYLYRAGDLGKFRVQQQQQLNKKRTDFVRKELKRLVRFTNNPGLSFYYDRLLQAQTQAEKQALHDEVMGIVLPAADLYDEVTRLTEALTQCQHLAEVRLINLQVAKQQARVRLENLTQAKAMLAEAQVSIDEAASQLNDMGNQLTSIYTMLQANPIEQCDAVTTTDEALDTLRLIYAGVDQLRDEILKLTAKLRGKKAVQVNKTAVTKRFNRVTLSGQVPIGSLFD